MKFIVIERKLSENSIHILYFIFSKDINHSNMYEASKGLVVSMYGKSFMKCVSAGFYSPENNTYYGESVSLKIKCHPNTTTILNMIDYLNIFDINNSPFK